MGTRASGAMKSSKRSNPYPFYPQGFGNASETAAESSLDMERAVGLTATVPVEIVLAAGLRPIDLNNLFIGSDAPGKLVAQAEAEGFAPNICAWIKGIYSAVLNCGIKRVIAVMGGDCSNTVALGELLERRGVEVLSFEYPLDRSRTALSSEMEKLRRNLGASWEDVRDAGEYLKKIRKKLMSLDRLTWEGNRVSGFENHLFLVSSSDFQGDPKNFENELDDFLHEAKGRSPRKAEVRLGYLGVPPIFSGFYELVENLGGRIVFNEVQRQFSLPFEHDDMLDLYLAYTYPYDAKGRIADIAANVRERGLEGLIHYTQTFCYRQLYDILLRESLPVPILTLEGDRPGLVDTRTALRIETFIEMLHQRKE